ncbi:MAG: ATP-binding protein [Tagaea sp.]
MRQPSDQEVKNRLGFDNPWWATRDWLPADRKAWPKRAYFPAFLKEVRQTDLRRAVVLMGPRRVGKTVMIRQTIQQLIEDGVDPKTILYCSLETPVYIGLGLERMFRLFCEINGHDLLGPLYVFFDEVQYLKHWEVHLKSFVDSFTGTKAVASGSAAAALRYASVESGAGRFSDFLLPPLSFAEFLEFTHRSSIAASKADQASGYTRLNAAFVEYLNYGGFPEAVLDRRIREDFQRFVGEDIVSKVMLRDLPSLYGIDDPQELAQFFALLAFNTGQELNVDSLSQKSGVSLNTVRKYLQYLEAALLVRRVERIDKRAKSFKRASTFKVYLTNPSLRAALFGPLDPDSADFGHLVETAVFNALKTIADGEIRYARWDSGEVDFVLLDPLGKPEDAYECKWSDTAFKDRRDLVPLIEFARNHDIDALAVSSRSMKASVEIEGVKVMIWPAALIILITDGSASRSLATKFLFSPELVDQNGLD